MVGYKWTTVQNRELKILSKYDVRAHTNTNTHTNTCMVGDRTSFPPEDPTNKSSASSIGMFRRQDKKCSKIMSSESTSSLNQTIPQRLTVASVAKRRSWTSNMMRTLEVRGGGGEHRGQEGEGEGREYRREREGEGRSRRGGRSGEGGSGGGGRSG